MKHTTTLARIRQCEPCADGWSKLLIGLGYSDGNYDAELIVTLADIAKTNKAADALWAIRAFNFDDDFKSKFNLLMQRFVNRALAAASAAAAVGDAYAADIAYAAAGDAYAAAGDAYAADIAYAYAADIAYAYAYAASNAAAAYADAASNAAAAADAADAYDAERELQRQDIIEIFGNE